MHDLRGVVVHDCFAIRGGGERLALTLAQRLGLTLCYGFRTAESYEAAEFEALPTLDLQVRRRAPKLRTLALALAFARRAAAIARFEVAVYSGVLAPLAVRHRPRGGNILYCHTPPRFLYDRRAFFLQRTPAWQRPALRAALQVFRTIYESAVSRMQVVLANSQTVRARIERYLGRQATVVYPPCATERFRWCGAGDYYLSLARLEPLKRVDSIIAAFKRLPHARLVVASHGSEAARLRAAAGGARNIRFVGWLSNAEWAAAIGNCIAGIYVPDCEDFGIAPVECMAAGKPVIAAGAGGPLETLVHGETGLLLAADPTPEMIADAVRTLTPARAAAMRAASEARSRLFSTAVFTARMREILAAGCGA